MRLQRMIRFALLFGACFATGAKASVVFQDDLDGTPGMDIVGTVPGVGGNAWTGGGLQPVGQILFALGGGVEDVGPNSRSSNTFPSSTLLTPFLLSALPAGEVLHLHVTMANISSTPLTNPFESTRVDLVTDSPLIGNIALGEFDNRNWGAGSFGGSTITSSVTTGQSGLFALDLYLDPNDAMGDGATFNAVVTVNHGSLIRGKIAGLSAGTTISQVSLVRNIDDEVFFNDLTLETVSASSVTECPVLFLPRTDYATGSFPTSLGIADLNQDGKLDLTVSDRYSDALSVLLGNGFGGFGARTDFPTGTGPTWVALADFNEDGKLDFATTNQDQNKASVLLGNGDGTMGGHSDFATEVDPTALAIADLNGDGHLDVAVANQSSASVSVLLGNGAGGLGAESHYAAGSGPLSIAVGDLDGAGGLDLAVANNYASTVSVLLGNGDGTFAPAVDYATGDAPFSVTFADVNGDAKQDLVVADQGTSSVSVLLGNGAGGLGPRNDFSTGDSPVSVALADFDGDGRLDVATCNFEGHTVSILRGDGLGGFVKEQCDFQVGNNPEAIAIADLNGDGRIDVATVNYSANTVSVLLNRVHTLDAPRPVTPVEFAFGAVRPNPSRGLVRAPFTLPREMFVRLRVVDVLGRNVAVLANGQFPAGPHEVTWNGMDGGRRAPTGVYFMNLEADGKQIGRRVVLAR